jgi:hypothetical protein
MRKQEGATAPVGKRVPFSAPVESPEYIASFPRIICGGCGEYVYSFRHIDGGDPALPSECYMCGFPTTTSLARLLTASSGSSPGEETP